MRLKLTCLVLLFSSSLVFASPSQEASDPFTRDPSTIGRHTEPKNYQRDQNAREKLNLPNTSYCFWYNSDLWKMTQSGQWNRKNIKEISFESPHSYVYASILVEQVPIPAQQVKGLVFERAEENFNGIRFILDEQRNINGSPVHCFLLSGYYAGNNEALKTTDPYYLYFYVVTNKSTTIQVIAFCTEDVYEEEEENILSFLNGISMNCH